MSENKHPIQGLMDTAMQKIKEMTDANTVVGKPITASDGTMIIPVSKVSVGFASGGSDFPSKTPKDLFGGGSGGGVSIQPLAFIVISNGNVKLLSVQTSDTTADRLVNMVPEAIDRIGALFKKEEETPKENTDL